MLPKKWKSVLQKINRTNMMYCLPIIAAVVHVGLLINFARCGTMKFITAKKQNVTILPSFTICSNIPVRRPLTEMQKAFQNDLSSIATYGSVYQLYRYKYVDTFPNISKVMKDNEILSELMKLDIKKRLEYAEFPVFLGLTQEKILDDDINHWVSHISNNIYYGNCITFNGDSHVKDTNYPDKYRMKYPDELKLEFNLSYFRNGVDMIDNHYVMVIHEPYTEPIFDESNIIKLWPETITIVTATKSSYTHEIDCIPREEFTPDIFNDKFSDDMIHIKHVFQDYHLPKYLYSEEACVASCLQNLTIKYCNCQIPFLNTYSNLPPCQRCKKIPQKELDKKCNCKPPCSYNKFDLHVEMMTTYQNSLDGINQTLKMLNGNGKNKTLKLKYSDNVVITTDSHNINDVSMVPACKIEVILSQIGGIIGTYAGLCIFTIVEVIYDFINKIMKQYIIKKYKKRGQNRNSSTQVISMANGRSSISMVSRIEQSKVAMKLFWGIVLLAGLYTTVEQGYHLFKTFNSNAVTFESKTIHSMEFPSITICSNNLVKQEISSDEIDLVTLADYNSYKTIEDIAYDIIIEADVRPSDGPCQWGLGSERYVKKCQYWMNNKRHDCLKLHEQMLGQYGNCATFNPGFLNDEESSAFNPTEVKMVLQYVPPKDTKLMTTIGIPIFIHPKGTSPNALRSSQIIYLVPGYNYHITFSTIVTERLPPPFTSRCVSPTSPAHQWRNNLHSHNTQYLYTTRECSSSFNINETLRGSFYANWALSSLGRHTMSSLTKNDSESGNYMSFAKTDDCVLPCREVHHVIKAFQQVLQSNISGEHAVRHNYQFDNVSDFDISGRVNESSDFLPFPSTTLKISPFTMDITVNKETPTYDVVKILYEIGGTMGLWVGISVLSIIELKSLILIKIVQWITDQM